MKKLVLTVAFLGAVVCSYAQGTVAMGNSSALVSVNGSLMPATATPTYRFAAFYAPANATVVPFTGANWDATLASLSSWTLLQQGVNSASTAGRITWTAATPSVPGFAAGSDASIFITAWADNGSFATWDAAKVGALPAAGSSEYIRVLLGGGTTPVPSVWGADTTVGTAQYFASTPINVTPLAVVPEPTSFALAGLGAAALLIFRRRN
jgi:hypothetical protein